MNFLNSLDVTVNAFIIMWRCPLFCYSFVNQESLVNNTCWRKQKDHLCSFVFRRWDRRRRNSQHKQIRMFLVMFSVFGPVSFRRCFLCGYQSDPDLSLFQAQHCLRSFCSPLEGYQPPYMASETHGSRAGPS